MPEVCPRCKGNGIKTIECSDADAVPDFLIAHGLINSHWGQRILAANEAENFTDEDVDDASSWVTCACGQLDKELLIDGEPRTTPHARSPRDRRLRAMGLAFSDAVGFSEVGYAAIVLVAIQRRATQLLALA